MAYAESANSGIRTVGWQTYKESSRRSDSGMTSMKPKNDEERKPHRGSDGGLLE